MSIEEFLGRLRGVQASGEGKWVACCPAHADENPSLGVSVGRDGRILVHCYAGCTAEAVVEALGLRMSDLMPDKPDGRAARKSKRKAPPKVKAEDLTGVGARQDAATTGGADKPEVRPLSEYRKQKDYGKLVKAYDYQDASGAVVFRVERRVKKDGRKTFIQMHPDPESRYGWGWGVTKAGVKRVPFHLPKILAAGKAQKSVIICEGEKDVLAVERIVHIPATCNPGGAGKWESGWGEYFAGVKSILIIADKDPTTKPNAKTGEDEVFAVGQRHACDVEAKLRADGYEGQIVKFVVPDVEDTFCKDFSDWAEARAAHGLAADRAAFFEAVKQFSGWPKEWEFSQENADAIQRAAKTARNTISSNAQPEAGGSGKESDGEAKFERVGRYAARSPRSPSESESWYLVDFDIDARRVARFEIGVERFKFEGWGKTSDGEYVRQQDWSAMTGKVSQFVGMAYGCLKGWDSDFKLANAQRYALVSSLALAWLRARGKFFADQSNPCYDTSLYFDQPKGVLYRLHSDEFYSFLATVTNINRKDKTFEYMMSLIDDMAMDDEITPRVVPSKEWDRRGEAIYISNGDSRICKITAGKAEDVPNGTDGIVFVRGSTLDPWKIEDVAPSDPFVTSLLFRHAALEKETDRMNCRLWFLNLFACHTNKPILLVTGPARSGKTRLLQGMKQFLGLRESGELDDTVMDIDPTDKGLDSFWVTVDRGRFEIFDNYDTKIKWAESAFQTAATNGSVKRRELYKTTNLVTLRSNAYIGVTSNNPIFTTEGGGLPDRIITATVTAGRKEAIGAELLTDIRVHRNEYMAWLVNVLKAVLADDKPVDESINKRHPDYGAFATKCGRAIGDEAGAVRSMEAAELDKALLPLRNDVVAKEILAVLLSQTPVASMRFTAGDMSDRIISKLGDDESDENTKKIYGARRVGKALNRLSREFGTLFRWSASLFEGRTRYDFTGLTSQGELVFASAPVGLVGLDQSFPKSAFVGGRADGISTNAPTEPTEPTGGVSDGEHARAQAHPDLSALKGESIDRDAELYEDDDEPWFNI